MATRLTDIKSTIASYAELDDKMLVLDFQAGQPAAFVEIHRRYSPLAKHVCKRFLPNAQDADEAFQETMIRVFQGLFRFNGQFALQPWIARIATNVSTRIGRRGLGTILTGAALKSIKEGNPYYGKTSVLGTPYVSGYEPIKDVSGATIGVYFVGYTK